MPRRKISKSIRRYPRLIAPDPSGVLVPFPPSLAPILLAGNPFVAPLQVKGNNQIIQDQLTTEEHRIPLPTSQPTITSPPIQVPINQRTSRNIPITVPPKKRSSLLIPPTSPEEENVYVSNEVRLGSSSHSNIMILSPSNVNRLQPRHPRNAHQKLVPMLLPNNESRPRRRRINWTLSEDELCLYGILFNGSAKQMQAILERRTISAINQRVMMLKNEVL